MDGQADIFPASEAVALLVCSAFTKCRFGLTEAGGVDRSTPSISSTLPTIDEDADEQEYKHSSG
jgi:hypothetical protein